MSQLQQEGAVPAGVEIDEMKSSYLHMPCFLARPGMFSRASDARYILKYVLPKHLNGSY